MRELLFALCAIFAVASAGVVFTTESYAPRLLGSKECTWGPSFWCQNLTNAAKCGSTQHCIKKVWETMKVPEDTDSVCDVCKDMVKQARDQLESNQTQEDLKAVFEGSCSLMRIKQVVKMCDDLVDEFIPQLVETLASQMDPSIVCFVAGLCNSAYIDHLIEKQKLLQKDPVNQVPSLKNDELKPDECSKCYTIAKHLEEKLKSTSRDNVLDGMLHACGHTSSFSDACASIVIENFATIYSHLEDNFRAKNICHLSGQCSGQFHKHDDKSIDVEIRPLSSVGIVEVGDDLPCKFCEQLIGHLRDLLVANTTELEFERVLEGLCNQTKSFAPQCISIVDEYYLELYNYLVKGLNSNGVCRIAGVCPDPGKEFNNGPIWPLLPEKSHKIGMEILKEGINNDKHDVMIAEGNKRTEAEEMQLPIERIMGPSIMSSLPRTNVEGKSECAFCEYLLHYLQQVITNPATEDHIKLVLDRVCKKLPESVEDICSGFLDTYKNALIGIIAQEIDPSIACPMVHACPSAEFLKAWEALPKDLMIRSEVQEKPSCPLCLFAVEQLYSVIKDNKTESSIEHALEKLCGHLPNDLKAECKYFVDDYSKELVDMMLADLTPPEVCVYLKLCNPNKNPGAEFLIPAGKDGEIMTNEIPRKPVDSESETESAKCTICTAVMGYIENAMKDKSTKDEIESIIHRACNDLPKKMSNKCNNFVDQYADLVIQLLSEDVSPREVCTVLSLCQEDMKRLHDSIAECALCQGVIATVDNLLANPQVDHDIESVVSRVCKYIAPTKRSKCVMMMEIYEQSIVNILRENGDRSKTCAELSLCSPADIFGMSHGHRKMVKSSVIRKLDMEKSHNKNLLNYSP